MRIAAFTVGNIDVASSRLRSFYLFSIANEFGVYVSRPARFREAFGYDVVHIQKILSLKIIFAIIIYRLGGSKVIFDIDDQPGTKIISFLGTLAILYLSSVITVDSEPRRNYWKKYLFFKSIVVINDVADTVEYNLKIKTRNNTINSTGFFWIGHSSNIASIDKFIQFVSLSKIYSLTISTNGNHIQDLQIKYPSINFVPWTKTVAFQNDILAKFMILNHDMGKDAQLKSDNKMVLSILSGFIPIVSRTHAYENLANALNMQHVVFDSQDDVIGIAENINRNKNFISLSNCINYINSNYSRSAVFSYFISNVLMQ